MSAATPAPAGLGPPLLCGLLGGIAHDRARQASPVPAMLAMDSTWRGDQERPAMDGGRAA